MKKPQFVYVTYIGTTPEKLWNALVDAEVTRQYWDHFNVSDWKPGSKWEHQRPDASRKADVVGTVVESTPPKRLVVTWADPAEAGDPTRYSRVTFEITPMAERVRLTVIHDDLPDSKVLEGITDGWPRVLSSLKSLLETGKPLKLRD
jgi:uncharacterized protein YndB with AHSA1/START domain